MNAGMKLDCPYDAYGNKHEHILAKFKLGKMIVDAKIYLDIKAIWFFNPS